MTLQEAIEQKRRYIDRAKTILKRHYGSDCKGILFSIDIKEKEQELNWLLELKELKEEKEKYVWHDLTKNPEDLPPLGTFVEVVNDDGITMFAERIDILDAVSVNSDGTAWQHRFECYDKDVWTEDLQGPIVGWRYDEIPEWSKKEGTRE